MLGTLCSRPKGGLSAVRIAVATLLCAGIVLIAWHGLRTIVKEGFEDTVDPNIVAFNKYRTDWSSRAVASGLIQSKFFPTYAAIFQVPPPAAGASEADFLVAVDAMAAIIKNWYVRAQYAGDLNALAAEIDATKPTFTTTFSASGSGVALPEQLPPKDAAEGLNRNMNYELQNFMTPMYAAYKELLDMGAQAYLTLPDPPPSAREVEVLKQSKYGLVEDQILAESGGKTVPVYRLLSVARKMRGAGLSETLFTLGLFDLLPKTVSQYTDTLSYLNKKAELLAANANNLQAPPGETAELMPVRGSASDPNFDVSAVYESGFMDLPDSLDELRGSASMGEEDIIAKLKSLKNVDEAVAATYRVSETRRRFLAEQKQTFDTTLKNTIELYGRLKAMREAAGTAGSSVFAAIAAGADLNSALSASAIEAFFGGWR